MRTLVRNLPKRLVIKAPDPEDIICWNGVIFPELWVELPIVTGFWSDFVLKTYILLIWVETNMSMLRNEISFCRTPRVFCEMLSAMFIRYFWDEGFGTTVLVPVSFREIGSWKVFHFIAWQEVLWINMKRDEVEPKSLSEYRWSRC